MPHTNNSQETGTRVMLAGYVLQLFKFLGFAILVTDFGMAILRDMHREQSLGMKVERKWSVKTLDVSVEEDKSDSQKGRLHAHGKMSSVSSEKMFDMFLAGK